MVTVADLVAVDPVRLNQLSGVAEATRREVKAQARQWRDKFGAEVTGRGKAPAAAAAPRNGGLPDPVTAAELLAAHAGTARAVARARLARLLLGLDPGLDPFASYHELAALLRVTRARVAQQMGALQDGWAAHPGCRDLLDSIAATARQALADLGGIATVDELAGAVLAALPPAADTTEPVSPARIAAGLLRLGLDRAHALSRADAGGEQLSTRRRDGRIALLASDPGLLDPAEVLGRTADQLVAQARAAGERLVPAARAAQRLQEAWARACAGRSRPRWPWATGGCCGWPRRWPRTPPCPGPATCTTGTCPARTRSRSRSRAWAAPRPCPRTRSATGSGPSSRRCRRCPTGPAWTS